jgi:ABC-type nitrate/sulfonate/bicarbonate transport system permease component
MSATVIDPRLAAAARQRTELRRKYVRHTARGVGRSLLNAVISLVVVLILWVGGLWAFNVTPYIGKGPIDVWNFLFTINTAAANRELVGTALGQTLYDASIGFIAGLVVAILVSVLFTLFRSAEHALMPIAMLLRSVPLVAMTPVIILIFGREEASVAVMGAIVVLFPALVNIVFGLRSASPQMLDLITVYGGNNWTALRKVAIPASLPAFFAAVKISVPGAITGALLVEWLATGKGIGYGIISAVGRARTDEVWADVVVITVVSILLYNVVALLESFVLGRFGSDAGRAGNSRAAN